VALIHEFEPKLAEKIRLAAAQEGLAVDDLIETAVGFFMNNLSPNTRQELFAISIDDRSLAAMGRCKKVSNGEGGGGE